MVEEKKEDIAFEIFQRRVEQLKEMTENIGKKEKQNSEKDSKIQEKIEPKKIVKNKPILAENKVIIKQINKPSKKDLKEEDLEVPEPPHFSERTSSFLHNFKRRINTFEMPKTGLLENKKSKEKPVLKRELIRIKNIEHPAIKDFFGFPKKPEEQHPKIPSAEKKEIFYNLKRIEDKIDKNKEEVYKKLLEESAESKRMIEIERGEIKNQMFELLGQLIDKLDTKDKLIKKELFAELSKIKNKSYYDNKDLKEMVSKGSEETKKILEEDKNQIKGEFLEKIANLRNRIVKEERKTEAIKKENLEKNKNFAVEDRSFFSLFNRFKKLPGKLEVPEAPDKEIESYLQSKPKSFSSEQKNGDFLGEEGDIIAGMSKISEKHVDLGLPRLKIKDFNDYRDYDFEEPVEEDILEKKPFNIPEKLTKKIETPGKYEKSIKDIVSPKKTSKFDDDFERAMQKAVENGMKEMNKKTLQKTKSSKKIPNKKSVYIGEDDFNSAKQEIELARRKVHGFEKNVKEKAELEKKEHEKIIKILEDAEGISRKFSKINSGMLGKIRI